MDKPISIKMKELEQALVDAVNASEMPVTISAIVLGRVMQSCQDKEAELERLYLQEGSKNELC